MQSKIDLLKEKYESGFLGFWIRKYRVSYLIVLLIVVMGIMSAINIPKESSPSINLGMISVMTVYPGTNPEDIDGLVTQKIYKQIKDIDGIDKITSTSSLGVSSIMITLKTSVDSKSILDEVRNNVNRAVLPTDAKTPIVTDVSTNTSRVFSVFVYDTTGKASRAALIDHVVQLQNAIQSVPGVKGVDLGTSSNTSAVSGGAGDETVYDVDIIIPDAKLRSMGITLAQIATAIRGYNVDQPIGNYTLGEKNYDYRIEGKYLTSFDFLKTPIALPGGAQIMLGDIATIERHYKDDSIKTVLLGSGGVAYREVGLTVNKNESASIFSVSTAAKAQIEELYKTPEFAGYAYKYSYDLADTIHDDYDELFHEAMTTLILVFLAMYIFVGFKDSLFATMTLPLAFLSTFILLYYGGYTMNFLTNFSLILSFGIAVDTIIVIVQAASAKLRVGYDPRTAIMLALREYAIPIISGVSTTIVVFIPMMMLPGMLGKFLAYIPITIFGVLASGLILALTVNSALYLMVMRRKNSYVDDPHATEYATEEEKELLALERVGKTQITEAAAPLRIRIIHNVTMSYKRILRKFLENTTLRRLSIFLPIILFILSIVFLPSRVGFDLFPTSDNNIASFTIEGPAGMTTEAMATSVGNIDSFFHGYPEINYVSMTTSHNLMSINLQLTKKATRASLGQRDVFAVQDDILNHLKSLEEKGFKVTGAVQASGPPSSSAVGLKLIAAETDDLPNLIQVSKDFQQALRDIPRTKNITTSSTATPGQFIFHLKKDVLALYGVTPSMIYGQITNSMNGITVGTVEDNGSDMNVVIQTDTFAHEAKMEDILSIPITVGTRTFQIGDFVDDQIQNAIASVSREDGRINITVGADLEKGQDSIAPQQQLIAFAEKYPFPPGISYVSGGQNTDNAELINAVISSFFLAIIVIFAILTLQFNSFSQPAVILYSVIMSLPFVMVGLLLTDNKFSLPFGIGFIAFTGIAVNHGIILIDAINHNLKKGMEGFTALVEAGSSRLEPMVLTTVTTALGILPIALRDKFWSGMGFTIIFGVISASFLTLFIVKGIYYEIYVNKHEGIITKIKKKWRERHMRKTKTERLKKE